MNHFLSSEIENTPPEEARFHVIPAPLEDSVSYGGGTARGPEAILKASDQLELWDGESVPAKAGIYTTAPVGGNSPSDFLDCLEQRVSRTLEMGKIPVVLGGEHTVTLGACRAVFKKWSGQVGLVQIDAHADLREAYEGNPLSHASVIRRIHEETSWPICQLGIRACCLEEAEYQRTQGIHCLSGENASLSGPVWSPGYMNLSSAESHGYSTGGNVARGGPVMEIVLPEEFPEHLYLTVDVDGLDSCIMPATGTPVPGGLQWYQTLSLISSLARQRRIIGFDVVELAPSHHLSFCDYTTAELIYRIMGFIERQG